MEIQTDKGFAVLRELHYLRDAIQAEALPFARDDIARGFAALEILTLDQLRAFCNWEDNYNSTDCIDEASKSECIDFWREDSAFSNQDDGDYTLDEHIIRFINSGNCPVKL